MQHADLKDTQNPYTILSLKDDEGNIKNVENAYKKAREDIENNFKGSDEKKLKELKRLESAFQSIVETLEENHIMEEESDETLSISLMPGFETKTEVTLSKNVDFTLNDSQKKNPPQKEPFEQVRSYTITKRICGVTDESTLEEIRALASETQSKNGELLKTMRECAGITLEEISNRLKVSKSRVNSIEACTYDNLPAPVYTKGLVKAYLKYLGISDNSITNEIFLSIKKNTA